MSFTDFIYELKRELDEKDRSGAYVRSAGAALRKVVRKYDRLLKEQVRGQARKRFPDYDDGDAPF